MKTKFLLPVLAMVIAIGMSFTTVNSEQSFDYVRLENGNWQSIQEQPCTPGFETCQVQDGVGGPIYDVYDEMDLGTIKSSTSDEPNVIKL